MNASHVAFLNETARFEVREDRGVYDAEPDDRREHLYKAQELVGDAWNLARLVLASLEDEGDARAMQIHTALAVIENKLGEAFARINRHEMRQATRRLGPAEEDDG